MKLAAPPLLSVLLVGIPMLLVVASIAAVPAAASYAQQPPSLERFELRLDDVDDVEFQFPGDQLGQPEEELPVELTQDFGFFEPDRDPSLPEILGILACYGTVLVVFLGVWIALIYFLSTTLAVLPTQYQQMPPGQVWLLLIPIVNLAWIFVVFTRIPKSYQAYFYSIGRRDQGDCGEQLGLWYCILALCSLIPCIGGIPGLIAVVILIMFVVKMADLKNHVRASQGSYAYAKPPIQFKPSPNDNPFADP